MEHRSAEAAYEVVVVGAGAAGLWAAARAAEELPATARVLLLEKTPRVGTKVLASGGTHCNLTTTLGPDEAARLFRQAGERFLRRAFRNLTPERLRMEFEGMGVETVEAPLEKIFPRSGRARDVRDALLARARAARVEVRCDAPVARVEPLPDGWRLVLASGDAVDARRALLCPGGASYPRTGTTGDGYAWLAQLDLPVVPPVPALVPLTSDEPWVRELTGVALQEVDARLVDSEGRQLGRRERPVLFTHTGVSGPGAMDLSVFVARAPGERLDLVLDTLPAVSREELRDELIRAAGARGAPRLWRALGAPVPRRLFAAACRQAALESEDPGAQDLSRAGRHALVEALKGLRVPIDGTLGMDKAEVTAGGLALEAVDPGSMQVRGHSGLYVFGELLDLDGPIGGLNFQAAFATAELAALDAARA